MCVGIEPGGKSVGKVPVGRAVSLKTISDKGTAVGFWEMRVTENVGGGVPAVFVTLAPTIGAEVPVGAGD